MTKYCSGTSRSFWTFIFNINAWALVYILWPLAFLTFLALAGDGRFRESPVPVYNCSVVNDTASQSLHFYSSSIDAETEIGTEIEVDNTVESSMNNTAAASDVKYLLVQRPGEDPVQFYGNTSQPSLYSLTLSLTNCSLHSVLPVGDLVNLTVFFQSITASHNNDDDDDNDSNSNSSSFNFGESISVRDVPIGAVVIVGALFIASLIPYMVNGNFENTWVYEGLTCPNRVLLFMLRTSFFDLFLNVLIALGLALLIFFRTGPGPDTISAQALSAPLYVAGFLIAAKPFYLGLKLRHDHGGFPEANIPAEIAIFIFGIFFFLQVPVFAAYLDGSVTDAILVVLSPALIAFTIAFACCCVMYAGLVFEACRDNNFEPELAPIIARYYTSSTITFVLLICLMPTIHFLQQQLEDPNVVASEEFPRSWIETISPLLVFGCLTFLVWLFNVLGDAVASCVTCAKELRKSAARRALEAAAAALRTTVPMHNPTPQQHQAGSSDNNDGTTPSNDHLDTASSSSPTSIELTEDGPSNGGEGKPVGDGSGGGGGDGTSKEEIQQGRLKIGTKIRLGRITDNRFTVRDGILLAASMHSTQTGRIHAWNEKTGRYAVMLGTGPRGMLVAALPEQLSVDAGLQMTKERLRLLRLLSSQADTAATVQADFAQLQEERRQIENEWAADLARLVEAKSVQAVRTALLDLGKQVDVHHAELCTELNRRLLIRAAEMFMEGQPSNQQNMWTDDIKENYGRILRRFTGAARLLAAARANGGDKLSNSVPFPGAPPKPQ